MKSLHPSGMVRVTTPPANERQPESFVVGGLHGGEKQGPTRWVSKNVAPVLPNSRVPGCYGDGGHGRAGEKPAGRGGTSAST